MGNNVYVLQVRSQKVLAELARATCKYVIRRLIKINQKRTKNIL